MDRFDHCTHPTQTWCDCDWCRVIRAADKAEAYRYALTQLRGEAQHYAEQGVGRFYLMGAIADADAVLNA